MIFISIHPFPGFLLVLFDFGKLVDAAITNRNLAVIVSEKLYFLGHLLMHRFEVEALPPLLEEIIDHGTFQSFLGIKEFVMLTAIPPLFLEV